MKKTTNLLVILLFFACADAKETSYIGSTPANAVVRSFLGIPLKDSVDFIRWQLVINNAGYQLHCNYGICKPNTNGFIDGGKKVELTGICGQQKNEYKLKNGDKFLKLAELNKNLLHIMDSEKKLLVGNGGWSYTLNNVTPVKSDEINTTTAQIPIKDSLDLQGRTPCNVPGVVPVGVDCYKLKWHVVLYADPQSKETGTYRIAGTRWRQAGGNTGNWKTIRGKNGSSIYQLNNNNDDAAIYLLNLDDHVFVFTDASGNLLVGNEDFSYTMNAIASR